MFYRIRKTFQRFFIPKIDKEKFQFRFAFDSLLKKYQYFPRYKEQKLVFGSYHLVVPDALSVVHQLREIFIEENLKFIADTAQPVIYDCGANVGTSVLYFKKIFPEARINAFEAAKTMIPYLEQNLARNHASDQVELIPKAVWTSNGYVDFGSDGADSGSLFYKNNVSKVESIRLKEWLANEKQVDFLKLDIEGAESAVIQDCNEALLKVKFMFIEYHSFIDKEQELDKILHTLSRNNFRYALTTVYAPSTKFDSKKNGSGSMDMILNIYATNEQFNREKNFFHS